MAVLFYRPVASHSLVCAFVQGVMCLWSGHFWDLNLVLSVLQKGSFLSPFNTEDCVPDCNYFGIKGARTGNSFLQGAFLGTSL